MDKYTSITLKDVRKDKSKRNYILTELEKIIGKANKNINEATNVRESMCKTIVDVTLNSEINDEYVNEVKKLFTEVDKLDKTLIECKNVLNEMHDLKNKIILASEN
ncbi:hypothetical protein H012_gp792 [Acanthamoeba polyphaga moumouvirus]|uniref:Uncharacterized protein n=2 Tax=Moumouvirus TaxID=3080801 RepID=L7RCH6_9VIRU|nr:hypothetical protein H012_gp792 [Acanthamoeba polyphaga moumouvirus]AEX63170.1 hypothetical protein mv_R968 [Moumouvirus Monve]AGC01673.1 hypothetical protein Moumou_00129 [Acanthamoeba polyphaga moumouvirus]AQN68010.1 hypothetical protein [Saudi moumouvirus]